MIEAISVIAITLHFIGSISFAIGLIMWSVIFRKYWIKTKHQKFLFFKIPKLGFNLQFSAMSLIFLSFLFLIVGIMRAEEIMWPRLIAFIVLVLANSFSCHSITIFYKLKLSEGKK